MMDQLDQCILCFNSWLTGQIRVESSVGELMSHLCINDTLYTQFVHMVVVCNFRYLDGLSATQKRIILFFTSLTILLQTTLEQTLKVKYELDVKLSVC